MSGPSSTTTRWGVVGAGNVAALFVEGLADAPGAEFTAITCRPRARAEAFTARFGQARVHGDVDGLAHDDGVDVVYVATPNADHRATVIRLLDAGKAVVCEKPFALDASGAREIVAVARRKGVFLMEAMWTRFVPALRALVDRVRGGALGDLRAGTFELGHPFTFDAGLPLFDPDRGGGALLDLGPYVVSLALLLFGPPTSVHSQVTTADSGVDEHVTALLGHAEGRRSMLAVSIGARLSNGASIAGTLGFARLHEPLYRPEAFSIAPSAPVALSGPSVPRPTARLRHRFRGVVHAARSRVSPLPGSRTIVKPCRGNGYQYEAMEVMRCLRSGELESPLMPLDETVQVMETLDSIRRAWKAP